MSIIDELASIILNSKKGSELPVANSVDGTEFMFFWSNANQRMERVLSTAVAGSNEDIFFSTPLADSLEMPQAVGGIPAGTTVADLKLMFQNGIFTNLFFPTVLASISQQKSFSFTGANTSNTEVGTPINQNITITFLQGQIINGDTTVAGFLVGVSDSMGLSMPTGSGGGSSNGGNVVGLQSFAVILLGDNTWTVQVDNQISTTAYTDNKGGSTTVAAIESAKVSIYNPVQTFTISGRYNRWHYVGSEGTSPNNSGAVRALVTNALLSATSTGTFTIAIAAGSDFNECSFYCPQGKTILVNEVGNLNLDITNDFVETNLNVNDAAGLAYSNTKYTRFAGVSGYTNPTTFLITIS
jgi:hypothetical protein